MKRNLIYGLLALIIVSGPIYGLIYLKNKREQAAQQAAQPSPERQDLSKEFTALSADPANYQALRSKLTANLEKYKADTQVVKDIKRMLAVLSGLEGNYSQALAELQQFEKDYGLDYGLARDIAQTAEKLGNKAMAVDYYKKALEIKRASNDPMGSDEINELEQIIKRLEGAS